MLDKTSQLAAPLFSIVMPTRNRPVAFARAVASVSRQTLRNFELIVIDDCSDTRYARQICERSHCHFVLICNAANLGAGGSRNKGIAVARGVYIAFLDDDDEYAASFLQNTFDNLAATSDQIGLSWCGSSHIDYPDEPNGKPRYRSRIFDAKYATQLALFEALMSIGTGFGVTIKAHCLQQVGVFDSKLMAVEDADLFLRILSAGFIPSIVPGIHITVHNHRNMRLTSAKMHEIRIEECLYLLVRHFLFLKEMPTLRRQLELQIRSLEEELVLRQLALPVALTNTVVALL